MVPAVPLRRGRTTTATAPDALASLPLPWWGADGGGSSRRLYRTSSVDGNASSRRCRWGSRPQLQCPYPLAVRVESPSWRAWRRCLRACQNCRTEHAPVTKARAPLNTVGGRWDAEGGGRTASPSYLASPALASHVAVQEFQTLQVTGHLAADPFPDDPDEIPEIFLINVWCTSHLSDRMAIWRHLAAFLIGFVPSVRGNGNRSQPLSIRKNMCAKPKLAR